MNRIHLLLTVVFVLQFFSCKKDQPINFVEVEPVEKTYQNVPEPLWDFFERFENEAAERGFLVNLNNHNLTAAILEIEESGVAGTCSYGSHTPRHIEIDATFWNNSSDNFKEFVVFHELGHCVLLRGHREDAHANGTCVSLMRSGLGDCQDNYRPLTREGYLDELFGTGG